MSFEGIWSSCFPPLALRNYHSCWVVVWVGLLVGNCRSYLLVSVDRFHIFHSYWLVSVGRYHNRRNFLVALG